MILNPNLIYAEFLDNFLTIIQDEEEKNKAILVSGFLRARLTGVTLGDGSSNVPLSSVSKSNLIDRQGNFATAETSEAAERVIFFFDKKRTEAQLISIGVDCSLLSETQQLVFTTACQEAANRVIEGSLKVFIANLPNISNAVQQNLLLSFMQGMYITAFRALTPSIQFNSNSLDLTRESLLQINRERLQFLKLNTEESNVIFPDEELTGPIVPGPDMLSLSEQIKLHDELLPTVAIDPTLLYPEERLEHQAKLKLLQLYATILEMTKKDAWQVKAQWLRKGDAIQVGAQDIILPHSVSEIVHIMAGELSKKHKANYQDALMRVQSIAAAYNKDWYRWIRNMLPLVSASAELMNLLSETLQIEPHSLPQLSTPEPTSLVSRLVNYSFSFWSDGETENKVIAGETSDIPQAPTAS
jgi:hypothetical protein